MQPGGRRGLVDFDPAFFASIAARGVAQDRQSTFRQAYQSNHWGSASRSGPGSSAAQTMTVAEALPALCRRLGVTRLLDLPCGDFSWMSTVSLDGIEYIGADIVTELVDANQSRFGNTSRRFLELDLVASPLPSADLLMCRDCLVHLSHADVRAALANIARSDIGWVLTTTFPDEPANVDITTGDWRPINLVLPPFNLPAPVELLNERCSEQGGAFADKSLALWRRKDLGASDAAVGG